MTTRFKFFTTRRSAPLLAACAALVLLATAAARPGSGGDDDDDETIPFKIARIYWEYNASANDLGVHVTLDGEDWKKLKIDNPKDKTLFQVAGKGPYEKLGMTELFFEGAEPSLDDFPLDRLLDKFPAGTYEFSGRTVDGQEMESEAEFSHAIPDGPDVSSEVGPGDYLKISWTEVTRPPPGFPDEPIHIAGYQVIVEPSYQVTLPATERCVTVSPEFVRSLPAGENKFEVLAIEASGNQTLTEGSFIK